MLGKMQKKKRKEKEGDGRTFPANILLNYAFGGKEGGGEKMDGALRGRCLEVPV